MSEQLPLFEGFRPQHSRLSVTGGFATVDGAHIPVMKIGERVRFLVEGEVTAVKHKLDKDGGMERQHVVVLDGFTADERPIDREHEDMKVTISSVTADGEVQEVETTTGTISRLADRTGRDAS